MCGACVVSHVYMCSHVYVWNTCSDDVSSDMYMCICARDANHLRIDTNLSCCRLGAAAEAMDDDLSSNSDTESQVKFRVFCVCICI